MYVGAAMSKDAGRPQYIRALVHTRALARRGRKHIWACLAAGGLCGAGLSGYALGNPPLSGKVLLSTIDSVSPAASARSRSAASQGKISAPLLDLQLPMDSMPAIIPGRGAPTAYSGNDTGDPMARHGFGEREMRFSVMSGPETWLRRVHREGVPIVRLWNSKAALLSIGLNQRGKPGLWLIQKVP